MNRRQLWECVPCRLTLSVVHHTGGPQPTERQCSRCSRCSRPMGLVLFAGSTELERCSPPPAGKAVQA